MIGRGYCKATSFTPADGSVVSGRTALFGIVVHGLEVDSAAVVDGDPFLFQPMRLRDGGATGDIRYEFRSHASDESCNMVYKVDVGGAGILFEDGIYFQFDDSASGVDAEYETIDHMVLFHT